jgi:aspartyl/asparaginyl beta-hydroxylase (cupin superfamily)
MPLSTKINNSLFVDNYDAFKHDLLKFKDSYFSDYKHSLDELRDFPTRTGVFWQVCPLMYKRKEWPNLPPEIQSSETLKILKSLEVKPILAIFSYLAPNSDVIDHEDHDDELGEDTRHIPHNLRTNSVVKYHFALDVPTVGDCALIVGDETRILKNKDLNAFDETTTHSAYNLSNAPRGVLIVSFLRSEIY